MKKILRKHSGAGRVRDAHREVHEALRIGDRRRTEIAFETSRQSCLWITDRGRSRLIKH